MNKTKQGREADGTFNHNLNRTCRCGKTKGDHDAARPYPLEEADCPGFRAVG